MSHLDTIHASFLQVLLRRHKHHMLPYCHVNLRNVSCAMMLGPKCYFFCGTNAGSHWNAFHYGEYRTQSTVVLFWKEMTQSFLSMNTFSLQLVERTRNSSWLYLELAATAPIWCYRRSIWRSDSSIKIERKKRRSGLVDRGTWTGLPFWCSTYNSRRLHAHHISYMSFPSNAARTNHTNKTILMAVQ